MPRLIVRKKGIEPFHHLLQIIVRIFIAEPFLASLALELLLEFREINVQPAFVILTLRPRGDLSISG